MTDINNEITSWLEKAVVAKYETEGHAFNGNQYTSASGTSRGMLETPAAASARSQSHSAWVKGGMKGNSPLTTRILGQKEVPVGAHIQSPAALAALKADELARSGEHYRAADAYREAQSHTYGKTTYIGQGRGGRNVVLPASTEWKMAQKAADFHDAAAAANEVNKAADCKLCKGKGTIRGGNVTCPDCKGKKSVAKGDVTGHEFHGNQYSHAERALATAQLATRIRNSAPVQDNYRQMALRHANLGNELNEMVRQAQAGGHQDSQMVKDGIRGAQLAAASHFAAAKAYQDIADGKTPYAAADKTAQLDQAEALSHVAAMASNNPMGLGSRANGN